MALYFYDGPVMEFDRCIVQKWHGATTAPSAAKAKSNLMYQFKIQTNRLPTTKIILPGEVIKQ